MEPGFVYLERYPLCTETWSQVTWSVSCYKFINTCNGVNKFWTSEGLSQLQLSSQIVCYDLQNTLFMKKVAVFEKQIWRERDLWMVENLRERERQSLLQSCEGRSRENTWNIIIFVLFLLQSMGWGLECGGTARMSAYWPLCRNCSHFLTFLCLKMIFLIGDMYTDRSLTWFFLFRHCSDEMKPLCPYWISIHWD